MNQGVQTRNFAYNSLSRLVSAQNPESGTIQYSYDANGNLTQKTDARGVATGDSKKAGSVSVTTGVSVTFDITNTADIRIQGDNANDALKTSARTALENTPTVTTNSPDVPVALSTDMVNGLLAGAQAAAVSQVEKDLKENAKVDELEQDKPRP